jgi:Fe-S-cluster containining protein
MSFPCTKCGQCCQNIQHVPELATYHNGNGVCVHYSHQNGCLIYDDRPIFCRIDEGYVKFFASSMSVIDYYRKNAHVCNQLQDKNDVPFNYRVFV